MISIPQVRAGRALAGWSQERLGKAAGLSGDGVSAIETGKVVPKPQTLARIEAALVAEGVVFSRDGVRRRMSIRDMRIVGGLSRKEAGLARIDCAHSPLGSEVKDVRGVAAVNDGD